MSGKYYYRNNLQILLAWPRARRHGPLATMAMLLLVLAIQMVTLNVGCRHRQVSALALLEEHEIRSGFPFRAPERGSLAFWLRECIRRIGLLCPAAIPAERSRLRRKLRGLAWGAHDKPSRLAAPLCVRHHLAVNFAIVTFLSRAHS